MIEGLGRDVRNRGVFPPPRRERILYEVGNKSQVGDERDAGIPGNISNPAVKRVNADGTWRATSWESRSLPT